MDYIDEGYPRKALCALNYIFKSSLLLMIYLYKYKVIIKS
jgi:hypothetical protein